MGVDINESVLETLRAGIEPITMYQKKVYSCARSEIIGYISELKINSIRLGLLTSEVYSPVADDSDRGINIAKRALTYSTRKMESIRKKDSETKVKWISVPSPVTMVTKNDFEDFINKLYSDDTEKRKNICFEFPSSVLYQDPEKFRIPLLEIKRLGYNSILSDFGDEYCPIMKLRDFPFDAVLLSKRCGEMVREGKNKSIEALVAFVRGLDIDVIAQGLENDNEISLFYRMDCIGYTVSEERERMFPEISK